MGLAESDFETSDVVLMRDGVCLFPSPLIFKREGGGKPKPGWRLSSHPGGFDDDLALKTRSLSFFCLEV